MQISALAPWLRLIASAIGWLFLLAIVAAVFRSRLRPAGTEERAAKVALSLPLLALESALFFAAGWLLWKPLPVKLTEAAKNGLLLAGTPFYFGGLALYLWGLRSLGRFFGASSTLGVRLQVEHRLVTGGPFRFVRHPMYLGLILAALGGLFIFTTWAMLAAAIMSLGLAARARREDKALAREFSAEWEAYAASTPAWLPRFTRPD